MTAFTDAEPGAIFSFTGTEDIFDIHYGIPVTPTGLECEGLLTLGHLTDRHVLAVTNAHNRRVWGHRILPSRELDDLIPFSTKHAWILTTRGDGDPYDWEYEEAVADAEHAQPATLINVEWLAYEDDAIQSECPACGKPSRSTRGAVGPGRTGWANYHRCRACAYQWPAAPAHPLRLERERTWPATQDGSCFACQCLPGYPCTDDCAIRPDPVIGQPLCTRCRTQHPPEIWQQLAAIAYGTARQADARDEQRDRWLCSEALRGIPPAQAAQAWSHRVTQTAQRVAARTTATTA
ncbi:hypothetical protein [Streptomyces antimycoticus]|uniref:hypothetical protein n=1 Tax=Streptomyces antimycoticus TaxID=68175 RepID=UPI00191BAD6B|nr:hypothetical protein [Streptomyces antimycoticus]